MWRGIKMKILAQQVLKTQVLIRGLLLYLTPNLNRWFWHEHANVFKHLSSLTHYIKTKLKTRWLILLQRRFSLTKWFCWKKNVQSYWFQIASLVFLSRSCLIQSHSCTCFSLPNWGQINYNDGRLAENLKIYE